MGATHHHHHHHDYRQSIGALVVVVLVTLTIMCVEVYAGIRAQSLALVADAAHMVADSAGLIIAIVALVASSKPPTTAASFGYGKYQHVAALINVIFVSVLVVILLGKTAMRLANPIAVDFSVVLSIGTLGLLLNIVSASVLFRAHKHNDTISAALLHVVADTLGSVAVIVSGLVTYYTSFAYADSIATIAIALIIIPPSWKLLRSCVTALTDTCPESIDIEQLRSDIEHLECVKQLHALHVWRNGETIWGMCDVSGDDAMDAVQELATQAGVTHMYVQQRKTD